MLDIFVRAFILRNGFHANGDQSGKGYSGFTYRPFTLEGNFLVMNAIHEMLLQSWSPTPGEPNTEVLRVFPAVPNVWADVSFRDLRAEGGHRVSASRAKGRLVSLEIIPGRTGVLPVKDTFGGMKLQWSVSGVTKRGDLYLVPIRKGSVVKCSPVRLE